MNDNKINYSTTDKKRIAQLANRNLRNETALILTAGFAVLMVVTFFFGKFTFLPIAQALEIRPTVVWFSLSLLVSVVWTWLHRTRLRPKIANAQKLEMMFRQQYQEELRLEREAKIRELKNR